MKRELFLKDILNSIQDGISILDKDLNIIDVNPTMEKWYAYQMPLVGKKCYEAYHMRKEPCKSCPSIRTLNSGKPNVEVVPLIEPGGVKGWLELYTFPLMDSQTNKMAGVIEHVRDITERKRMEEALQKERNKTQQYFDIAGSILVVIGSEQQAELINKKGCEVLGYEPHEIIGKNWFDNFIPEKMREDLKRLFIKLIDGKVDLHEYHENPVLTKTGEERIIAWHNTVLRDNEGKIISTLSSGEDITDRKKLEDQLRHTQKMEAIGTLTGGIAHEFNNILTAILGYGSILKSKIKENDNLWTYIDPILMSSKRAADLTQSLLAFSRQQLSDQKLIDLNKIVEKIERIIIMLVTGDINVRTRRTYENLIVSADYRQIEQVLINLFVNARDAMPDGGVLTIETRIVSGSEVRDAGYMAEDIKNSEREKDFAELSFADTGIGMDERTKERIFEPFFTTKEVGEGTGLGLSMVYGIVKQHNGYVDCQSEPGKGAKFKIYLPLVSGQRPRAMKNPELLKGTETVLIAEDGEDVRMVAKEMFEKFGYEVIEAEDGEEAVRKFMENKERIQFLLLDVIMPKMNAKEVYDMIKEIKPDIKALFISGYPEDIKYRKEIIEAGLKLVSKPLSPTELLNLMRTMLDEQ